MGLIRLGLIIAVLMSALMGVLWVAGFLEASEFSRLFGKISAVISILTGSIWLIWHLSFSAKSTPGKSASSQKGNGPPLKLDS